MWKDVQPRNPTLKRISTPLIFHPSPKVWRESVCVRMTSWWVDRSGGWGNTTVRWSPPGLCPSETQQSMLSFLIWHTHTRTLFFSFHIIMCKIRRKTDFIWRFPLKPILIKKCYICNSTKSTMAWMKNLIMFWKTILSLWKHLGQGHVSQLCCITSSFNSSIWELRTAAVVLKAKSFPPFFLDVQF